MYQVVSLAECINRMIRSRRTILQIHHSESSLHTTPNEINNWHISRGFAEIGYHFVVNPRGIFVCRDLTKDPAGIAHFNKNSIAICFCGNFDRILVPEQYKTILNTIDSHMIVNVNGYELVYHRDKTTSKTCPGINFTKTIIRRFS